MSRWLPWKSWEFAEKAAAVICLAIVLVCVIALIGDRPTAKADPVPTPKVGIRLPLKLVVEPYVDEITHERVWVYQTADPLIFTADNSPRIMKDEGLLGQRGTHGLTVWVHVPDGYQPTLKWSDVTQAGLDPAMSAYQEQVAVFMEQHPETTGRYPQHPLKIVRGQLVATEAINETLPPPESCPEERLSQPVVTWAIQAEIRLPVDLDVSPLGPPPEIISDAHLYLIPKKSN